MAVASTFTTNMEVPEQEPKESNEVKKGNDVENNGHKAKRTKCPGIRVVGSRIYDSENGKTCHQCRQKTRDFAASCKNLKERDKLCPINFCHKCLLNRYGENAEAVEKLNDWKCPKCRGICNCSFCMKRRGHKPTGQLAHSAKASGFSSVSEMLDVRASSKSGLDNIKNDAGSPKKAVTSKMEQMNGLDNLSSDKDVKSNAVSLKIAAASDKELVVIPSAKYGKENSLDENSGLNFDSQKAASDSQEKKKKRKRKGLKEISNGNRVGDACQNRSRRRSKSCNEVPEDETNRNANDGSIICDEVSGKEANINKNCGIIHVEKEASKTQAIKDVSLNPIGKDIEEEVIGQNCEGTGVVDDDDNAGIKSHTAIQESQIVEDYTMNHENKEIDKRIPLPPGTMLTDILDIEFPPEDVGHALQFLEFCTVFGKVVDMKKGEAEAILRELIRKQNVRRGHNTLVIQFLVRLLTLILSESGNGSPCLNTTSGKNSWWKALGSIISGSEIVLKELQLDCLKGGVDGYYDLDLSKKLRILTFLCDEALNTEKIRRYIDDQDSRFSERAKESKVKVAAAKEKEKALKKKLQDKVAKAIVSKNGAPLSVSEHEALLSKIKSQAAQAHAEMLEAKGMVLKRKQRSDAIRTEPVFLDASGQVFWKLKCYTDDYAVLLQDIETQDAVAAVERWFVYGAEQKKEIEKYISSRAKRRKTRNASYTHPNECSVANQ